MRSGSVTSRHAGIRARLRSSAFTLASAAAIVVSGVTAASAAPATPAAHASASTTAASSASKFKDACAKPSAAKTAQCFAIINTATAQVSAAKMAAAKSASPAATPSGYGPSTLQAAYGLTSAASSSGSGETVYIVDAYDYPTAQADLNTYRSQYGLPACGSGCFTKVSQTGSTTSLPTKAGTTGWDVEEALDIDMVSAICPNCHITLVEAKSPTNANLFAAENEAVKLGAKFISNSWGESEYSTESSDASSYFNHPGVAIEVSAGDSPGTEFPSVAPDVTSVGGTTLSTSSSTRGYTESSWSSSGGGCSSYVAKPSWQTSVTGCSRREANDVSADADPNTGAAIYDSYSQGGWLQVGGTSESSPIIASVYALAGTPGSSTYPVQDIWTHEPSGLYAVGSGYSSVPGWGTPDGTSAFKG